MKKLIEIQPLQAVLDDWRAKGQSVAFIPTMGGLHDGHLSLVKLAKQKADKVVVSVFVNPAQFSENEDFDTYPRMLNDDLARLKAKQVDVVFVPSIEQIYQNGIDEAFDIGSMGKILCGRTRPSFFNGVVQVVQRLFEIVQPDLAIFGQKDYQQFKVIKMFTTDVEIVSAETVREYDGLAMSTRNDYLSANERKIAPNLYQTLLQTQQNYLKNQPIELLKKQAKDQLNKDFKLDYLEILDANTLKQITDNTSKIAILCAVFLASTRLIDNIIFKKPF